MTITTAGKVFPRLGKKRIATATKRLQRLRAVRNVRFLHYEDYRALSRNSEGWSRDWGYVRRADGAGSYGDYKETSAPDCAEDYLRALSTDDCAPGELYFYVPYASGSDYSGSTVERSNYLSFLESYGDNSFVHQVYGGYDTYAAAIGLTGLLTCADDTADSILEALEGLADYPVLDEEALSTLEMEGADSAWECWAADDFVKALRAKFDGVADLDLPTGDALRSFFEEKREECNVYWYCEGCGHDMYVDIKAVVAGIDYADVDGFARSYRVTYTELGACWEDYATESEAAARVEQLLAIGFYGTSYTPVKGE